MKKNPSLLIRYVLLLLFCSLPGSLSNRDVNDLIQTSSRSTLYTPHATSPQDLDLRRTPAATTQPWSSDSHKINLEREYSTPRNQDEEEEIEKLGDQTRIRDDSVPQNEEDETSERLSETTSVHLPTYFSYSTTRRANSRDRVNSTSDANRNLKGRRNGVGNYSQNSTSFINGRRNGRNNSTIVINDRNNNRDDVIDETSTNLKGRRNEGGNFSQNSTSLANGRRNGRNNSTIVMNDRDRDDVFGNTSTANSRSGRNSSTIVINDRDTNRDDVFEETSTSIVDDEDSTSRKNSYKTNGRGYGYTQPAAITSTPPTMTYSSDILKVTSPKRSTFGRRVNSTVENTTKLLPSDQVRTTVRYRTTTGTSPRDGRILTGRRKESTTDSDKYLERIQEQLSSSTGSQSYHDASKNSEYKKKPLKKDTEVEQEWGKQSHLKESVKMKEPSDITQKTTESWDERHKRLKLKESEINVTQKPIEDRYSTIIDSLSKGSGNIPQNIIIESQKNVSINNEPGTNLLDTVESKEANEKRETKGKEDDESKNGGDVIPVIVKNSVLGEGVSEVLNKTNSFRLGDARPNNESLLSGVDVGERKEFSESSEKEQSKLPVVEEENQEIKKKIIHSLKKPLLPPSGGKVEGFEDNTSPAVSILELNRTTIGGESGGEKNEEENKIKKINELQKTRIISSTSRVTSSSSNRLGSLIQHEYTTYASNNLENNILTTSLPRFTPTTPRITHHFSLKTTTEQSQPAENLIKQIPSFYPRKTVHESSAFSVLTTEKTPDDLSREVTAEHSRKTYSTEGTSYSEPGHLMSSTIRSSPIRKIVPWSTRLQKTTHMPETTMVDYSDGTVTTSSTKPSSRREMSSILFPVSPTTQSTKSDGLTSDRTSATTSGIPTATFLTSETPSSNTWSPLGYSSRVTSSFVDETSPTSSTGKFVQSSKTVDASVHHDSDNVTTVPTLSLSITTAEPPTQVDASESANKNSTQNVSTSESSASIWETTDPIENSTQNVSTSKSSTSIWETTDPSRDSNYDYTQNVSTSKSSWETTHSSSDEHISTSAPFSKITNTWGTILSTGNSSNHLQNNTNSEISLETSSPHPSSDDETLETTRTFFESTSWPTYEDGNSTEDLQFGDGDDIRWKSTTSANSEGVSSTEKEMTTVSGYGSEEEIGSTSLGDVITTLMPEITSNSTSREGFDGVTTSRSYLTSNSVHHASSSSISEQNSTSKPQESNQNSTLEPRDSLLNATSKPEDYHRNSTSKPQDSHQNSTSKLQDSNKNSTSKPQVSHQNSTSKPQDSHQNSTSKPQNSHQNSTSKPQNSHQNSTSKPQNSHQNPTSFLSNNRASTTKTPDMEDFFETDEEDIHTTTPITTEGEYDHTNEEEDDKSVSNAPTSVKPDKDNRIIRNGSVSGTEITTERNNYVMKISTTDSPMSTHTWITDSEEEGKTTVPIRMNDSRTTTATTRASVEIARPTWPVRPVTIEPDPATTNPQYMGLSLLIKGSTLQEICEAQHSLKRAIIFLFRNTTGRELDEDQIDFPSLTADECNGARALKSGLHSIDLILYDENGNFDDQLNSEFRMLWENNGLRTNIAIHDVYLVLRPPEDNQTSGMTIAVIVIACIGLTCLLLFFILMMILRKRQKKFSYGQRCTPVSLDDYSLDNISVYNSIRRKNARRASKRSYGNPAFDDPSAPSHQINFAALAHLSGNRKAMDDEFDAIPMIAAKMDELPPGAETRNRYANVIPLPETRVHLKVREGDDPINSYINANYVKGPKGVDKFYIACQAPMQSTVNDFWRMIWEQQSKLILMLTDLHENGVEKCFDYLPPSEVLDCHRLFGDYQVTLKKREVREKYVISHLQLKNLDSNLWREVTHLWYTSWPHQGTPSEGASIIAYLIEARAFTRNSAGPHVVHCSPGVGRTGTVLAIDLCIREFETSRLVDVPKTVYGLRRNRAGCVQTKDQYAFIYMVLNVYGTKLTGGALDSM